MSGIVVENYRPEWATRFESLKVQLWPTIQEWASSVEHVGSTSVPGLAAKPIIDMDVVLKSLMHFNLGMNWRFVNDV